MLSLGGVEATGVRPRGVGERPRREVSAYPGNPLLGRPSSRVAGEVVLSGVPRCRDFDFELEALGVLGPS